MAQIPFSRVQARYPERHVKGRHDNISQCKIANENVGDGLHLRVFIYNINNQHITNYGSEANQNGEGYL